VVDTVGLVYGNVFVEKHKPARYHPENPGRLRRALKSIVRYGIKSKVEWYTPYKASRKDLECVHVKGYIGYVEELVAKAPAEIDPDTYVTNDTLDAALYAYGTAIHYSIKAVKEKKIFFGLVRPPGHHSGREGKAMGASTQGFCIFNNIGGAAKSLLDYGVESIVILDFDAHHGNGTQEIFYRDDRVLDIDIHQDPSTLYPFTGYPEQIGEGRGKGYSINFILPSMAGDDVFAMVFSRVTEIIKNYNPEIVLVSAGFDGYQFDGMTELLLTSHTYYNIGKFLKDLGKPCYITLEGGYANGMEMGLVSFIAGLLGIDNPIRVQKTKSFKQAIDQARKYLEQTLSLIKGIWV